MKKIAYIALEPFKSLIPLLLKLIHDRRDVLMFIKQDEKALEMSEFLWRSHKFVPHGLEGEKFADIQPIIISSKSLKRSTVIIFEEEKDELKFETIILWNKKPIDKGFTLYFQQPDLSWEKKVL